MSKVKYVGSVPTLEAEAQGLVEQNKAGGWRLSRKGARLASDLAFAFDISAFDETWEKRRKMAEARERLLADCMKGRPGARKNG